MFQEVEGDFWCEANQGADALVCTINTVCKNDGSLVMGAGIAKDFAEHFEWLPDRWGTRTQQMFGAPPVGMKRTYPFLEPCEPRDSQPTLIGIHTKYDWKDPSPFKLVDRSVKQLYIIVRAFGWKRVLMTRPGCGHGGLSWERQVRPLLEEVLDERFVVITP
jgi:hypothetical protein